MKKIQKTALILGAVIIIAGGFWGWQKFSINDSEQGNQQNAETKSEENSLGNSQKVGDKHNQLLVRVTNPGEPNDGDIITIGGEAHEWGRMEKIKFLIVTIPVLTAEEKAEFMKEEDGQKAYRVAYEKFLSPEEIAKIKSQKEGLDKAVLISKGDVVKK